MRAATTIGQRRAAGEHLRHKQQVRLGRTISGRRGLFTNNMLVVPLAEDEDAAAAAKRGRFELIP